MCISQASDRFPVVVPLMTWMGAVGGRPTGSASRGIVSKRTCREQSYGMGIGEVLSNLGRSVACMLMTQCEWGTDAGGGTGSLLLVLGQGAAGWQGQGTALGGHSWCLSSGNPAQQKDGLKDLSTFENIDQ